MKKYSTILTLSLLSVLVGHDALQAQGCIAVRHMSCATGGINNTNTAMNKGQFQFVAGYRYLHSYKHFVGTVEQTHRVEQNTQVINNAHSFDFGLTFALNDRFSFALNVPYNDNARSSLYEHYGNAESANPNRSRFSTYSSGIGDIRLTATYWIFHPQKSMNGNVAVGLGVKAPTGNPNAKDNFHKLDKNGKEYLQYKTVDQSMQVGDGSWGFNVEMQGYQALFNNTSLYYNGFYLFSPRNINPLTGFSVADQYAARLGLNYSILPKQGIAVSLGGRIEGLPAIDLIGDSEGFRRPGYIISVEPGIFWMTGRHTFAFNLPIAVERNRIKSWQDQQDPLGLRHGDAAFADNFISATYSYRF
ncbi:MAG TPA: hypothetical protein PKM27_09305 [Saprospiraceae bacterium]|nr:hypothetical protein [Saprospiraceae bacterium]HNT21309.1 hypothetical protein [Saprospiraceae bacterium]